MKKLCLLLWLVILSSPTFGQSSATDHFRTVQSGTWNDINTWESSPDGINWITATLTPTYLANTISIRSPDSVYINASVTVDQVLIYGGAVLNHVSGTLTVEDGAGFDIDDNGTFMLSSASNGPQYGIGNPQINIATGAILRVAAAGLTAAGAGVNANNFVYNHNSILEFTLIGAFSTDNVTYFQNVNATTIPIFRVTVESPSVLNVGSNNPTTFNGLFQITGNGTVLWQNSGNRIFRNGIQNVGHIMYDPTTIGTSLFMINGVTATLGGTAGSLGVPNAGLQIGPGTTVTMTSLKTIGGNVVLLGGNSIIDLGAYTLNISGTVSTSEISSYIKTSGTGALMLTSVDVGGKLFPIGNSTINPVYISSAVTPNFFRARVVEPITPPIYNDISAVLRTWYIMSQRDAPNATISFGYSYPGDAGPLYSNSGPVEVGVNISSVWNIHQTSLTPIAFPIVPGTFVVTPTLPINYFNGTSTEFPFVVANNGAILSNDFFIVCRAQKQNDNAIINWKIQDANTVNKFEMQRSLNGGAYQTIAVILPLSNQLNYSYTDLALPKGTLLYKIKVNRNSGGIKYSNTVAIINYSQGLLITSISPNPVKNNVEIVLSSAKATSVSFMVYDIFERPVKTWQSNIREGTNYIQKDLSSLAAGIYHLLATTAETKTLIRLVKE